MEESPLLAVWWERAWWVVCLSPSPTEEQPWDLPKTQLIASRSSNSRLRGGVVGGIRSFRSQMRRY